MAHVKIISESPPRGQWIPEETLPLSDGHKGQSLEGRMACLLCLSRFVMPFRGIVIMVAKSLPKGTYVPN